MTEAVKDAPPPAPAGAAGPAPPPSAPRSLWQDAWRRLFKNRLAVVSLVWLVLISVLAALAPWIVPFSPEHDELWSGRHDPLYTHWSLENTMRLEAGKDLPAPFATRARESVLLRTVEVHKRDARVEVAHDGTVVRIELLPDYDSDSPQNETPDVLEIKAPTRLVIDGLPPIEDLTVAKGKPAPPQLGKQAGERTIVAELRRGEKTHELVAAVSDGKVSKLRLDGADAAAQDVQGENVLEATVDGRPFSHTHLLGTDDAGRDILSRVIFGGRISLMVGIIATFVSLVIGVVYGAVSGFFSSAPVAIGDFAGAGALLGIAVAGVAKLGSALAGVGGLSPESAYMLATVPVGLGMIGIIGAPVIWLGVTPWEPLRRLLPWKVTTLDDLLMRLVDILYAIPFMFFVIILLVLFGRNLFILFAAIGAVEWLTMARIVRGQVLSLKEKEFVEAAKVSGTSGLGIVFQHLIPNSLGPVIVYTTLTIPEVILTEAFLSFLGLSVQYEGRALESWGSLTETGMHLALGGFPWLLVWSSLALSLTLFALNFLGDGLRDALDPRLRGRG